MKIRLLEKYGIDSDVLRIWEEHYGPDLLPVQEKAIKRYPLLQGGNLIVFAPTTSGKTFIGEMLAVSSIRKGKRVLYMVPTKSLAEEKFAQFRTVYRPLGLVNAISTRDRREWDHAILAKEFDIAVIVYEKLQSLLISRPSLLEEIGVIILDELQMLSDEERGPGLELFLTKLLHARNRPQLLGLSAVLGQGEALARWLQADLFIEEKRPVELRKGIFCRGIFSYREHNSGKEGEEVWKEIPGEDEMEMMGPLASFLAGEKKEATLLFLKDKSTAEKVARKISERMPASPAREAIEELLALEETETRDFLIKLLGKGVGIHHADLSLEQRELVERHFRTGSIRVLSSTSTLAMGINCPAKNVLIESRQWHYCRNDHGADTRPLPRGLHENMAGRGGRFGYVEDFGRAILATPSSFKKKVWMDHYLQGTPEPLKPALRMDEIDEFLPNLIASGQAGTLTELSAFLRSTFTAQHFWKEKPGDFQPLIEANLKKLESHGLIQSVGENRFSATELGIITGQRGIGSTTALGILEWMKGTDPNNLTDLETLYALARTKAARRVYIPLSYRERRARNYPALFRIEIARQEEEGKKIFYASPRLTRQSEAEGAREIKKALVLLEWITPKATSELERSYQIHAGAILRIAEEFSRLAEAASALAGAVGWPPEAIERLSELSERLVPGVAATGLTLSRMRLKGLGRSHIGRLVREGFDSPEALAPQSLETLKKYLPERLAAAVYGHFHPEGSPVSDSSLYPETAVVGEPPATDSERPESRPVLTIDLNQQLILYRGIRIEISCYPFRLLAALARSPGRVVNKNDLYDAIYGCADAKADDSRPYERQLADHKRKILAQIRKAAAGRNASHEIEKLISVRRGLGYTLSLPPAEVFIIPERPLASDGRPL